MRFAFLSFLIFFTTFSIIRSIHAAPAVGDKRRYSGKISKISTSAGARVSLTDSNNVSWKCDDAQRIIDDGMIVGQDVTFQKGSGTSATAYDVQSYWTPGTISWVRNTQTSQRVTLQDRHGVNWFCDDPAHLISIGIIEGTQVWFTRRGSSPQTAFDVHASA